MHVIYRILNVADDSFYVGSSVNYRRRWWEHRSALKQGTHHCFALQEAWDTFGGDAFEFEVIEEVPDEGDLLLTEDTYLLQHAGRAHCYNTATSTQQSPAALPEVRARISASLKAKYAAGGYAPRTGATHSAETREKISVKVQAALAAGKGGKFIPSEETRAKMSTAAKGRPGPKGHIRTKEHRRRLSEANKGNTNFKGKHHTEEAKDKLRRPVVAFGPVGERSSYPSITHLREATGLLPPTVNRALESGRPLTKGPYAGWRILYAEGAPDTVPVSEYPTTRSGALSTGVKFYFTGEPCVRGHVALRKTKGACVECSKEDDRAANAKRKKP